MNLVPHTTIRHAAATLTPREYEVWYAHHAEGHSPRHIAAALCLDRSTIRETITRAERKLSRTRIVNVHIISRTKPTAKLHLTPDEWDDIATTAAEN